MDDALRSFTAFRVFGTFFWPPVPDSLSDKRSKDGVVEFHYVETGQGPHALLRWLPRQTLRQRVSTHFALSPDDLSRIPYLHRLSPDDLVAKFASGDGVLIRLDGDGNVLAGIGQRLLFRGARVFDQFGLTQDSNFDDADESRMDPAPDRRWVLARRYEYDKATLFSEIVIGEDTDTPWSTGSTIRFNLALPTPVAQSVIGNTRIRALPFSVTYAPIGSPGDFDTPKPLPVRTFKAGSSDPAAQSDKELDPTGDVDDARLGRFGFCRTGGDREFLPFPRSISPRRYWLDDEAAYRDELLGRFGNVASLKLESFKFGRQGSDGESRGHFWDSVAFPASEPGHTKVVFRSGIIGEPFQGASKTGDLVLDFRGHVAIKNPDQPSQYITTPSARLIVELELDYALASADIWLVGSANVAKPNITVRLGFSDTVPADVGQGPLNVPAASKHVSDLFDDAIKGMRLARIDLQHLDGPQPQSILPHVTVVESPDVRFMLTGRVDVRFTVDDKVDGRLDWGRRPDDEPWSGAAFRFSAWPKERFIGYGRQGAQKPEPYQPLNAVLAPRAFAYAGGATRADSFPVELGYDPAAPGGESAQFCLFRVFPRLATPPRPGLTGRLGGLEFSTAKNSYLYADGDGPSTRDYSHWRFGQRRPVEDSPQPAYRTASLDVRLRFAITSVVPLGVDVPWGDRTDRSRPLLVPRGAAGSGLFILDVSETLSENADRWMTASLLDTVNGMAPVGNGEYVLIGDEPFTITKFRSTALANRGTEENAAVATYDSDTRNWQLKIVAPHYHYEFPPQVVGESMDKPRRLEIVDAKASNSVVPPRPSAQEDPSGLQQRAVEFRLAPSAEIWIEPSDVARGYFLPEWASYEIFRQSGAYGLGAAVAAFRGEFLYGLSVGIDMTRETGIARGARVAEIAALTGRPPGKPRSSNADETLVRRWKAVSRVIARRPERLEIWARDLDSTTPFTPARFTTGVAFALRSTAVHRPAVARAKALQYGPETGLPRTREHGLSGGALWPIESANLFDRLLAAPASDGGSIERIALSPHGGDADQKATFLQGQVAVISETRNGFVQRHKVEVIGRIGVYWHRAKHVVVYERTVNPTAQFAPEGGIHDRDRTRRPVLRKVSEYVELLQPLRSYPDFASAKLTTCGSLTAVHFNSKVINVDSAWSEDVGDFGWRIPLWNRDGARKRPQVYARPDVAFVTHAEGEGDRPTGAQECLEPDNLFFFADFEKGGTDTDSWQSRVGIDFSAFPAPAADWQAPLADSDDGEGNRRLASALRVPRGHRRFTWRLAPASRKTALNAARADEPLYAGLESITFMRSTPADDASFTKKLADAGQIVNELRPPAKRLAIWPRDGQAPELLRDVGTALATFRQATRENPHDPAKILAAARALKTQLETVPTKLTSGDLKPIVDDAQAVANGLATLKTLAGDVPQRCRKLADDFVASLKRKELLIVENLSAWENTAYTYVPEPLGPVQLDKLKTTLGIEAVKAIRPAFSGVSTDRLGLGSGIEVARAVIRDFESDVIAVKAALDADLAQFRRVYQDDKPWSDDRMKSMLEKLQAERDGVLNDVRSAVSDAQLRLATDLDDVAHRVGAIVSEAIAVIGSESSALQTLLSDARAAVTGALDTTLENIDALLRPDNGKDRFAIVDDALARIQGHAGPYATRVEALRNLVTALRQRAVTTRTDLHNFSSTIGTGTAGLSQAISTIAAKSAAFAGELAAIVQEALAIAVAAAAAGRADLERELRDVVRSVDATIGSAVARIASVGAVVDGVVESAALRVHDALEREVFARVTAVIQLADDSGRTLAAKVKTLEDDWLSEQALVDKVLQPLVDRVVDALFRGVDETSLTPYGQAEHDRLVAIVARFTDNAREELRALTGAVGGIDKQLIDACDTLGGGLPAVLGRLEKLGEQLEADAKRQLQELGKLVDAGDVENLVKRADEFDRDIRMVGNDLAASYAAATGYGEKVFDAVGNLAKGGLAAAPSNILKLYAAAASAPELPNLDFARRRLAYYYGQLSDVIDTTHVEAWFGRLGDELKALGLSLPFDKLSDRLLPDDLSSLDIGRVFKNFGGIKLDSLFKGYKLPKGAGEAIKVTHAFDKKLFRAWVQIDVDVPIPGRRSLFTVGPFQLDFVDSRMVGQVRLEASKDTDKVEQTGRASVGTDIEAVVGGQTMVSLRKVAVRYERGSGLKIDFDPKNIKLNAIFQFVQDTLGSLFPDQVGGLNLIKRDGIPVGVEHEFSMPPVSLMFGTSGVTNIQISNRFALVAYPDFVIADRFSLSKPELPFLFSIFIIGGTGYITVDTEYRPFDGQLMVMVEAAAGGSASLGFAFGPVSGSVMITLSVALAYRKLIGSKQGGGLTVSLVLLVAGNVSVAGIVTVYMGLLLRMSYRDNGQIDASGTLTITVRISRFFKITARANVQYKLRGGRSQTTSSVSTSAEVTDKQLHAAKKKAEKLLAARG